jgi:pimeloyl-ACP methyl ester carboxylesterase
MAEEHTHRSISSDGTEIVGRVVGDGPPLVLVHGGGGDGDTSWRPLTPLLADRFTVYAPSTRGRGRSADHPDHSIDALVDDVVTFAESIGRPVGAFGHSSSLVLAAAARSEVIAAVAVHEPAVPAIADAEAPAEEVAIARMMEAAAQERHTDAVRTFFEESQLFNDDEIDAMVRHDLYEQMAPNVPAWCAEMAEYGAAVGPDVLTGVSVPALVLEGSRTQPWFRRSVHYVAERLGAARVETVEGGGHMAPVVVPDAVAERLVPFFLP